MKLPNGDQANLGDKLERYCLNPEHLKGKHKALLFEKRLGITLSNKEILKNSLKKAAIELGMGFTPLPSFASKKISDKAVKYKDTRDGFDGNSYDFDGLDNNREFN